MASTHEYKSALIHPDEMGSSQLDDVPAVITSAVGLPFRYSGSTTGKYRLFVRLGLTPDEGSGWDEKETFVYQNLGYLNSHIPSADNATFAGGLSAEQYKDLSEGIESLEGDENDFAGPYILNAAPGVSRKLPDSDFKQFLTCLLRLTTKKDPQGNTIVTPDAAAQGFEGLTNRIDSIVGLHMHFSRINSSPDMGGSKQKEPKVGEKPSEPWKILCPVELLPPIAGAKTASKFTAKVGSGKATSTPASSANESDEFGDSLEMTMKMEIEELGADASKKNVNTNVLNALTSANDKKNALNNYLNKPWATAADRPWTFENGVYAVK